LGGIYFFGVRLSREMGLDRRYVQEWGEEEENKKSSSDKQIKIFFREKRKLLDTQQQTVERIYN